jgi:hypothetical protein
VKASESVDIILNRIEGMLVKMFDTFMHTWLEDNYFYSCG